MENILKNLNQNEWYERNFQKNQFETLIDLRRKMPLKIELAIPFSTLKSSNGSEVLANGRMFLW